MARKKVKRIVRPSGVETSPNGKYFYWKCTVSGLTTFADEKRFKEVVAKYGTEKNLVKTYVLRPVQKYLDADFSVESIKRLIANNGGKKIPPLGGKKVKPAKKARKKGLKQFAIKTVEVNETTSTGSVAVVERKIYPWTDKPDYFKDGPPAPFDVSEATKDTCLFPNVHLNDLCFECPVYAECNLPTKYSDADRKNPKNHKKEPKVTQIDVVSIGETNTAEKEES
jgi:hypothetical protein